MGARIGHEEHERLVVPSPLLREPAGSLRGDRPVERLIGSLALARTLHVEAPLAAVHRLSAHRAQKHVHAALAIEDVHGEPLFGEAVLRAAVAEMELADRDDTMSCLGGTAHP